MSRMPISKLGHVGIYAQDLENMRDFYTGVLGLKITDEAPNAVFMSADPEREHHEFVLFAGSPEQKTCVQQISFSCDSLDDIFTYYERFKQHQVRIDRFVTHGNAISIYFYDPEGNRCEVYWTTPWTAKQPFAYAIDLTRPRDAILQEVEQLATRYRDTGLRSPESFQAQREQLIRDGFRVA